MLELNSGMLIEDEISLSDGRAEITVLNTVFRVKRIFLWAKKDSFWTLIVRSDLVAESIKDCRLGFFSSAKTVILQQSKKTSDQF